MGLPERLAALGRAAEGARWKVATVARVSRKLGLPGAVRWPGAARLVAEASRGRISASTSFRFHAANQPDRVALIQAALDAPSGETPREPRRISYGELDLLADRVAAALHHRGVGRGSAVLV